VVQCLAYTYDPACLQLVIDECGSDADALALAVITVNRRPELRNVLPAIFGNDTVSLVVSRFTDRVSPKLIREWNEFLRPRRR
jgi:hypothetical protein